MFSSDQESHNHSLETLNLLASYDTFMESINTVCDMGCGSGLDLEWWATRTLQDDDGNNIPLNIKCTGIDINSKPSTIQKNISYKQLDFEYIDLPKKLHFDVIWSHNSFQYALNPLLTLQKWNNVMTKGGMLALTVPSTTEVSARLDFRSYDYQYHNFTVPNLMYMLAVNGFECAFMKKEVGDPWISVIAYKTDIELMDPRNTRWYHLAETDLIPQSAKDSINRFGYLRQQDLVIEWLNKSLHWLGED